MNLQDLLWEALRRGSCEGTIPWNQANRKPAEQGIRYAIDTIRDALLRGESVKLPGLGTFKVVVRKERDYLWPTFVNTGEVIGRSGGYIERSTAVPAHLAVVFKAEKPLRRMKVEMSDG